MVGIPLPFLGAIGAITLEIGGGLLLITGFKVRPVAFLLAIFTMVHFFKSVMMTGVACCRS